ncbi:MAG: hypothetical protein ACKPGW_22740 [Microcystis panniformis]
MILLLSIPNCRANSLSVNPFLADEAIASGSVSIASVPGGEGETSGVEGSIAVAGRSGRSPSPGSSGGESGG